jgi:hypothetical protein
LSVREVLAAAGGHDPWLLPGLLCRTAVEGGFRFLGSRLLGNRLGGAVRRAEAMWFSQAVEASWARSGRLADLFADGAQLRTILAAD